MWIKRLAPRAPIARGRVGWLGAIALAVPLSSAESYVRAATAMHFRQRFTASLSRLYFERDGFYHCKVQNPGARVVEVRSAGSCALPRAHCAAHGLNGA